MLTCLFSLNICATVHTREHTCTHIRTHTVMTGIDALSSLTYTCMSHIYMDRVRPLAMRIQVTEKKAKSWCASKGNIPYFETSAKEDFNVDTAFQCVAKNALKNDNDDDVYLPETVDMSNRNKAPEKQSSCC